MTEQPSALVHPEQHVLHLPEQQILMQKALAFFQTTPVHRLPPGRFTGTGIYALYYTGGFPAYAPLVAANQQALVRPIYVGKAVAKGWRTSRAQAGATSTELSGRLGQHANSINLASNLDLRDFRCRLMIMVGEESDLIGSVEAMLIRTYQPLWNAVVDGFGNHDPGSGRYAQALSEWDALHPGRAWATKLTGSRPDPDVIQERITQALSRVLGGADGSGAPDPASLESDGPGSSPS